MSQSHVSAAALTQTLTLPSLGLPSNWSFGCLDPCFSPQTWEKLAYLKA